MKSWRLLKNITLSIIILIGSYISVNAGFGVSPTDINSEYLKPGASFTQEFTLSRSDATSDMNIQIVPDLKDIDSWFTFDPGKTFIFKRGQTTQKFKVIVKVPSDAQYTDYKGVIRVNALPTDQAVGGVSITQGVRLDAGLTVTEQDIRSLSILSIKALDSQEGKPIRIEIVGQNIGNVDASPTLKVTVMDMLMNVVEEHEVANFGFVKPNETTTLIAEITSKLPTGEYFINVQVLLDGKVLREERLVFNIVNIPGEDKEDTEEEKTGFQIGSIFSNFKETLPYILISIIIVLVAYLLITLMWKRKDLQYAKEKIWAVMLGSKKYPRYVLSFVIGLLTLLVLIFYPLVSQESIVTEVNEEGETQGVQDIQNPNPLNVIPGDKLKKYVIYEEDDINSKVIYEAQEGETFNVIQETDQWYTVELSDTRIGWLQKNMVKSTTSEER